MQDEKKRILKLVEEGKITASEALSLLELLEDEAKQNSAKEKEIVNDLSTVVILDEEEKKEQDTKKKIASAKDMIFDFVDNVMTKVKDLDLNLSKSANVNHAFQHTYEPFKEIDIEVANGNVEIAVWEQDDIKVECEAKVYRTDNTDEARKTLLDEVTFSIKDNKLYYIVGQKWMRVNSKLYLPKNHLDKLKVRLFNGNILGNTLDVDQLKIKTANGKITLNDLTSLKVDLETANGNIELNELNAIKVECDTINGAIKSNGSFQEADFETFNGLISVENCGENVKLLKAKSASGAILITVPQNIHASGEAKSYLGGLKVNLQGMKIVEEKNEVVQKAIKFTNELDSQTSIYAESKTASVSIKHN
ncbi:DUF4097 domain-containing protein [Bacillus sp. AGMB 02131]|uniref:DUF4097 domain-containing protein n=1 Tax=Peribacillus faecalis TaxID=2772559 RepID=A0A927CWR2_9BACI|nr:DUF4097 domain-containing protein [Peribacillus faecalis]MBD3108574.1 DUF4097 domain-containing protein [Peribacillus faecalis]